MLLLLFAVAPVAPPPVQAETVLGEWPIRAVMGEWPQRSAVAEWPGRVVLWPGREMQMALVLAEAFVGVACETTIQRPVGAPDWAGATITAKASRVPFDVTPVSASISAIGADSFKMTFAANIRAAGVWTIQITVVPVSGSAEVIEAEQLVTQSL